LQWYEIVEGFLDESAPSGSIEAHKWSIARTSFPARARRA
jgi:hypothetical protein